MNSRKLQQHKEDLISKAYEEMTTNEEMQTLWFACFPENDLIEKKVSQVIFSRTIEKKTQNDRSE